MNIKQQKQIVQEDSQLQLKQVEQLNIQKQTQNDIKNQTKLNSRKTTIVDQSILELTSAIKLLSNKINSIGEKSNEDLTNAVNLLSNKINNIDEKSFRTEERFQSVNVQPVKLLNIIEENQKQASEQRMDNKEQKQKRANDRKRMIDKWLGVVCNKVFSVGFLLYKKDELKLKEVKAFCSQNMLRNIISLSKANELTKDDFEEIDNCLTNSLLPYFKSKYPQTLQSQVNIALSKKIAIIDNIENNENDLVFKSGIKFEITQNGIYNSDIMKLTNYVVQLPQKQIKNELQHSEQNQEKEKNKTLFEYFQQKMNGYMKLICQRPQDRKQQLKIKKAKSQQTVIKNEIQKQPIPNQNDPQEKQKIKQYQEKVKSYSHFEIGQKLSKNFELYSQTEIQQENMKFRNSAQIRVLTKWCQELSKYFDQDNIMQRQIPFKMKDGSQGSLSNIRLRILCALLQHEKQQLTNKLNKIKQSNHSLQSIFSKMTLSQSLEMFLQQESIVGQFSSGMYKCYQNYLISYLNILIDRINKAQKNFLNIILYHFQNGYDQKSHFTQILQNKSIKSKINTINNLIQKDQNQKMIESNIKYFSKQTPQLISFSIGDLVRCRFTSKQDQILTLYQRLNKDHDIKIVRVKNRLNGGNRDILINALFKDQIMTEIQLCIKSQKSRFIQCSNQFNHFFYELKRAQFGPISQMVNIWVNYDKRSEHFMERIDNIFGPKIKKTNDYQIKKQIKTQCCVNRMSKGVSLPFQCSFCEAHYFDVYESDGNTVCENCNKFFCLNCELKIQEITKALPKQPSQKIQKITVLKQKTIFILQNKQQLKLVLINLKSKHRKIKPFRIIQQLNRVHIFEKITKQNTLNLIKTFKKNQFYQKQIIRFLNTNLVIQIHGLKSIVPQFDLQQTMQNYFFPKIFQQASTKQKNSILIRDKHLKDQNISTDFGSNSQQIKTIDFSENQLTNMQFIKTFPNIEFVSLTANKIQVLPQDIFEFEKLKNLQLSLNKIVTLPQATKYSQLQKLYLDSNQIQQIPNEFFNFQKLQILRLQKNKITKLPQNKPNMNNLQSLNLSKNHIQQIPNQFFNFDKLKIAYLWQNNINKLPNNKPNMNNLQELYLHINEIQNIPDDFFNFDKLKIAWIHINKIKNLPKNKPNMNNLQLLNLSQNQIQIIPNNFFNFDKLKIFILDSNKIKTLPQNKPNMNNLQQFTLSQNQIQKIPNNFFNFDKLKSLNLSSNNIKILPKSIPNMNNLQQLFLNSNKIEEIPQEFFNFEKLKKMYLNTNQIKTLPKKKPNMNNLEQLRLYMNQIQEIPQQFLNFQKLKVLSLRANRISKLPQNNINMNNLEQLNLSYNKITQFSNEFFNFNQLKILELSQNSITHMPNITPKMDNLQQLSLQQNQITNISTFFTFQNLKILNMRSNPINQIQTTISQQLQIFSIIDIIQLQNQLDQTSKTYLTKIKLILQSNNRFR